jgi:hypothetical protein
LTLRFFRLGKHTGDKGQDKDCPKFSISFAYCHKKAYRQVFLSGCSFHFKKIFPEQNKLALLKIGKVVSPDVLHPLPQTGGDRINVE